MPCGHRWAVSGWHSSSTVSRTWAPLSPCSVTLDIAQQRRQDPFLPRGGLSGPRLAQARAPRTSGSQVRGNLRLLTRPDTCVQPPPAALVLNWAPLISQARLHVSPSSPQPCDRGCSRKPVGQRRPAGRLRSAHTAFSKSEDVTVKIELASPPEETADPEDMPTPVPARQLPV